MRARDSIGVAKLKIDQKIRRESGDDLTQVSTVKTGEASFSRGTRNLTEKLTANARTTCEITGKKAFEISGRMTRDLTGKQPKNMSKEQSGKVANPTGNLSGLGEPISQRTTMNRSKMISSEMEMSERPLGRKGDSKFLHPS